MNQLPDNALELLSCLSTVCAQPLRDLAADIGVTISEVRPLVAALCRAGYRVQTLEGCEGVRFRLEESTAWEARRAAEAYYVDQFGCDG